MSEGPATRMTTRAVAEGLRDQLARVTAQIAEFEARPEGRSALLAALRKRREELEAELALVRRYPNED